MYISGKIGFRPIEERDLETLRLLHNEMSTLLQLGNVDMASTDEQIAWWKSLRSGPRTTRYSLVEVATDKVVGILRMQNMEQANKNCEIGLDILAERRGEGLGQASYETALEYLFLHANMHMVYVKVGHFNDRARTLYKKLGFEETGYFKEYLYRHGKYWDYLIMCMTIDAYRAIRSGKGVAL